MYYYELDALERNSNFGLWHLNVSSDAPGPLQLATASTCGKPSTKKTAGESVAQCNTMFTHPYWSYSSFNRALNVQDLYGGIKCIFQCILYSCAELTK